MNARKVCLVAGGALLATTVAGFAHATSPAGGCVAPIAHWPFEENLIDRSPGQYHGKPSAGAAYEVAKTGNGLKLDGNGAGAFTVAKSVPREIFATGDYTISGNFKTSGNATSPQVILSAVNIRNESGILIELQHNGLLRWVHRLPFSTDPNKGKNLYSKAGTNLNNGQFHEFEAITRGGKMILNIDGVQHAIADEPSVFNESMTVHIGKLLEANNEPRYFKGTLDELKIYNHSGECASSKIPDVSHMLTAAHTGKVTKEGSAYKLYKNPAGEIWIDTKQQPINLVKEQLPDGEIAFRVEGPTKEWLSIEPTPKNPNPNCGWTHFVRTTKTEANRAIFRVLASDIPNCNGNNPDFCIKPEDNFVKYELKSSNGGFLRHCGELVGIAKLPANPNNVNRGDVTWRMTPATKK